MGPGWFQWIEISWDIRPPKRPIQCWIFRIPSSSRTVWSILTDVFVWFRKGLFSRQESTRSLLNLGEGPEFQGPQNLDQDLWLELGLEVLPSSWREVRRDWNVGTCRSWKLEAGGWWGDCCVDGSLYLSLCVAHSVFWATEFWRYKDIFCFTQAFYLKVKIAIP